MIFIKRFILTFTSLLFLILSSFNSSAIEEKKDILVIHSYNDSLIWTQNISKGILSHLENSKFDYNILNEYMDSKNINTKEYSNELLNLFKAKYKSRLFDAIIISDNAAFEFVIQNREELFKNTPLFFCGVNFIEDYDLSDFKNIYGLSEKTSAAETISIAQKIHPEVKNVYVVLDDSLSGKKIKKDILEDFNKSKDSLKAETTLKFLSSNSLENASLEVSSLTEGDMVLYGVFIKDSKSDNWDSNESARVISKVSSVPVYGLWDLTISKDIIGGKLVSSFVNGTTVADLMNSYFNGDIKETQVIINGQTKNQYIFNFEQLRRFKIDKSSLPKESHVLFEPSSFLDKNKDFLVLAMFLCFVFILYLFMVKSKVENKTSDLNEKLIILEQNQIKLIEKHKMDSLASMIKSMDSEFENTISMAYTTSNFLTSKSERLLDDISKDNLNLNALKSTAESILESSNILNENLFLMRDSIALMHDSLFCEVSKERVSFNVLNAIQNIVTANRHNIGDFSVDISCDPSLKLLINKSAFIKIISLLLINTKDHASKGFEKINIDIRAFIDKGSMFILYRDNGLGISKEDLPHIFEPFFSTKREEGHMGLGLTKAYNLTSLTLGGSMICKSEKYLYTEFLIEIPQFISNTSDKEAEEI